MISVDFHPRECTARVETYGADDVPGTSAFVTIQIQGPNKYLSIFGKPEHTERFEQIAALLNECFAPKRLETPAPIDRATEAGERIGQL